MSSALLARARALGGVFAWSDAEHLGLRPSELRRLVRDGHVLDLGPRAYALRQVYDECTSVEQRHRLRALATVRSFGGRVAASHHSALALYGLPFWQVNDAELHVARIEGTTSRRRNGLVIH